MTQTDPSIEAALEELVAPETRGDPMSALRWTLKSTSKLAAELTERDHPVSARKVAALLKAADYSLQGNRKKNEGQNHVDRDSQFRHINQRVTAAQARLQPVISVDAKRRNWSGISRTTAKSGNPRAGPRKRVFMISSTRLRTRAG